MERALLICNPSASQFTGGVFREVVAVLGRDFDLTTEWPTSANETVAKTSKAVADGIDVVFAMGGDGVAHHVANTIVGSNTSLGIIPAGTTNVLARIFGIPEKPLAAAELAATMKPQPTRMVRVEAETDDGIHTMHATFSLGVGFDADVVRAAESRPFAKERFGGVHYATTAVGRLLSTWRTAKPQLRLTCDGDRFDGVIALTQVHRPYTYFGKIPLHLTKEPHEGIVTLAANNLGVLRSSEIFMRSVLGRKHRTATGTKVWYDYATLEVEADPGVVFHADGELLGTARHLAVTPHEGAMRVIRPADR